jgi:hypothetical protein
MVSRAFVAVFTIVATMVAYGATYGAPPLEAAHAHNDYWHDRPLFDALARGFTSVEADVFFVDGKLLVGHERGELKPERTLESLYLEPLARRVTNSGQVHEKSDRFFLLVDIKSNANDTYVALHKVLSEYEDLITIVDQDKVRQGAITVVVSGNRPIDQMKAESRRYAGVDGRLTDLGSDLPAHLMPMISDNWTNHFFWRGDGEMPANERAKLREIVNKVHEAGRVLRFWATPENETVWRELRSAGVDLVGTDQLDRLAAFLLGNGQRSRE